MVPVPLVVIQSEPRMVRIELSGEIQRPLRPFASAAWTVLVAVSAAAVTRIANFTFANMSVSSELFPAPYAGLNEETIQTARSRNRGPFPPSLGASQIIWCQKPLRILGKSGPSASFPASGVNYCPRLQGAIRAGIARRFAR